jgi:hypothetical protein
VEWVCGSLGNLACSADNQNLIAKAGGTQRLLEALDNRAKHGHRKGPLNGPVFSHFPVPIHGIAL